MDDEAALKLAVAGSFAVFAVTICTSQLREFGIGNFTLAKC